MKFGYLRGGEIDDEFSTSEIPKIASLIKKRVSYCSDYIIYSPFHLIAGPLEDVVWF